MPDIIDMMFKILSECYHKGGFSVNRIIPENINKPYIFNLKKHKIVFYNFS